MTIVTRIWPSPVERAIVYQLLLLAVLLGGLYLTGLIDNETARVAAFCIWIFVTGLQLLFSQWAQAETPPHQSTNVVPIGGRTINPDRSSDDPR
jgi:hypothetical protein